MRFLKRSVMLRLLIYSDILYLILRCWENGVLQWMLTSGRDSLCRFNGRINKRRRRWRRRRFKGNM